MNEERVYECERCGHAYTEHYGSLVEMPDGSAEWVCDDCKCREKVGEK